MRAVALGLRRAELWQLLLGPLAIVPAALLRRETFRVVLPVSPAAWWRVERTIRRAVVLAGLGLGSITAGILEGVVGLLGLGALLLAAAWLVRLVGMHRWWVGLCLVRSAEAVRVRRVSPEFAQAAHHLFVRSLLRTEPQA